MAHATLSEEKASNKVAAAPPTDSMRFGGVHGSKATPYLFLLPYLARFAVFIVVPAVFGLWISLHDWDFLLPGKPFVGLDNYTALADPESVQYEPFWRGMRATAIFTWPVCRS